MPTSSITHNFTISTKTGVERFISAIEAAEKENTQKTPAVNNVLLTSPQEILHLMQKRGKTENCTRFISF